MNKKKFKICPICGKAYEGEPALSRKDNETAICPECGMVEALEAFANRYKTERKDEAE